jgi:hypothetical protein
MLQVCSFSSEWSTSIALNQWVIVIHLYIQLAFFGGKFSSFDNPKQSNAPYTKESHGKNAPKLADFEELICHIYAIGSSSMLPKKT